MFLDVLKQLCHHTEVNLQVCVRLLIEFNGIKESLFFQGNWDTSLSAKLFTLHMY